MIDVVQVKSNVYLKYAFLPHGFRYSCHAKLPASLGRRMEDVPRVLPRVYPALSPTQVVLGNVPQLKSISHKLPNPIRSL